MAFSTLVLRKEMIIKSATIVLILIHLIGVRVTHGYLGCANESLVPCLNTKDCINIKDVCTTRTDCVDEHGEEICHFCTPRTFDSIACVTQVESELTFECLSPSQICDTRKNCINNEDESSCGVTICRNNSLLCKNGTCSDKGRMCDHIRQCPDGSDEGANCHQRICGLNNIRCPTGACIPRAKMCDGIRHCSDGFDEENCTHTTSTISPILKVNDSCSTSPNTYTCSTSEIPTHPICLSSDRICDGYKDCPMGDDEHDCVTKCASKSNCPVNSSITCIEHPVVGQLCRCLKPGYRLTGNPPICQDFNECDDSLDTYCSFNCQNTDGNFICTCPEGYTLDETTKSCRGKNDRSKPNLLVLFNNSITLYNIYTTTDQYASQLPNTIRLERNHPFDYIQYDYDQQFIIYYDQIEHNILCISQVTLKTIVLLSNLTVHGLAYSANERTLFIIENQSRTLRMYSSIICDALINIKMHSWPLTHISNSIHSMEIDVYNRQLIFASNRQFMISNMSEPNVTKVVHTTDRDIKRFIYDASFKRIFWTAINISHDELFPVYTCTSEFKQCHDTSIRLTSTWPFAFFNDTLLYTPSSRKFLKTIPLYGKNRFTDGVVTSTHDQIHSFLLIDHQQTKTSNLCMKYATTRCINELCLQINSTEINCLSIDENTVSLISPTNIVNPTQSIESDNLLTTATNQRSLYKYRPSNTILLCIVMIGVSITVLALFGKYCHIRLNRKSSHNEPNQHGQWLGTDQPNLDEFTVLYDDRNGDRLPLTNQLNY